jgi:hypothetical protein
MAALAACPDRRKARSGLANPESCQASESKAVAPPRARVRRNLTNSLPDTIAVIQFAQPERLRS